MLTEFCDQIARRLYNIVDPLFKFLEIKLLEFKFLVENYFVGATTISFLVAG